MTDWTDRYIAAWNAHDATAIVEFMTSDGEFVHWWSDHWKTFDVDQLRTFVGELVEDWSTDYRLEKGLAVTTEHAFAIEYVERGTNDAGEDATNKPFCIHSVFVGELRDGKIARVTDYAALHEYQFQMRRSV